MDSTSEDEEEEQDEEEEEEDGELTMFDLGKQKIIKRKAANSKSKVKLTSKNKK